MPLYAVGGRSPSASHWEGERAGSEGVLNRCSEPASRRTRYVRNIAIMASTTTTAAAEMTVSLMKW